MKIYVKCETQGCTNEFERNDRDAWMKLCIKCWKEKIENEKILKNVKLGSNEIKTIENFDKMMSKSYTPGKAGGLERL